YLDSELVDATASIDLAIDRRQHESEVARTVDRADPFVLSFRSSNHQPVIRGALECKACRVKLELGISGRSGFPFLIFGDEPKRRLSSECGICRIRTGG